MHGRSRIRVVRWPVPGIAARQTRAGRLRLLLALACAAFLGAGIASAQSPPPAGSNDGASTYSPAQIDQMVAPIALYPDELLGQILTAATYPLEVVQADRWLQEPANAALRGDDLARTAAQLPWDPSVRSLLAFPQILSMLDGNLDWTEQLGDAFLAQQPDVMDSVQRLRQQALAAGTLLPSPQQIVTTGDQGIDIAPADPGELYVPVYDPQVAYGGWAYPDYPPDELYMPGFAFGSFIGFAIVAPLWGWHHWDWPHHHLDVGGGGTSGGGHRVPERQIPWQHDPQHRAGVPYRDGATRARLLGDGGEESRRDRYRGYAPANPIGAAARNGRQLRSQPMPDRAAPPVDMPSGRSPQAGHAPAPQLEPIGRAPQAAPSARPPARPPAAVLERPSPEPRAPSHVVPRPPPAASAPRTPPEPRAPSYIAPRPATPAMESFGSGPQVHQQEQRGASSRSEPASPGGRGRR